MKVQIKSIHSLYHRTSWKTQEELVQIQEQARFIQVAMAIRKLRKNLGLSQTKLAQKMHVKREFISRLESGQQNITLDTLYKVAEATNKDFQFSFS